MRRSQVVRWLQVLLPLAALAILSTLFLLGRSPDPGSAIPYAEGVGKIAREPGMTAPEYSGVTPQGATVSLRAAHAAPRGDSGTARAVTLDWQAPDGLTIQLAAEQAAVDAGRITLSDGVRMTTSTGYTLTGPQFIADPGRDRLSAPAPVSVTAPFGTVEAGGMELRRGDKGAGVLDLNGGVRLVYRP
ncbi:MAG TPA: hypothetical protein PLL33_08210 [Paracoccus sp. (in: a-proteobacteria)]|nr:hypothetical protein [Paracoccus sp. (in: a-proteobacteria)]